MIIHLRKFVFCIFFLSGIFIISCAPPITHYAKVDKVLMQQDYYSALELIEENKEKYAERNAVIYYLEKGIINHFASNYEESNESLSRAESIMDELYTKSISKQAASFMISDNIIPYRGEDFENAMVNLFMALNYIGLNNKEDAFIRFLMGVLYETDREINDAFISYRKAEEIYSNDYLKNYGVSPSSLLIENLLSAAKAMDFQDELSEIQEKYTNVNYMNPARKRKMAEIYCIHYNGRGPIKAERSWHIAMPDKYIAKIAYPIFEKKSYQISQSKITLKNLTSDSSFQFKTDLMENIASIASMNLENRINRIKAKAIARATIKYLATTAASEKAEKQGGAMLGLLAKVAGNVASVATEQADIRHWRLLPAEIRAGRVIVPPGDYEGKVEFVNAGGNVLNSRGVERFTVQAGEKRFLIYQTQM